MNNLRLKSLVLFCVTLGSPAYGAMVAAKKDAVDVLAAPQKDAKVIVSLKKGEVIDSIERKGMYWQVKTAKGENGFVSVMNVVAKSSEGDKTLSKAIREAAKGDRSEGGEDINSGRARSAVMGVRGLDESSETQMAGSVKPNLRMVYAMEDRIVSGKKIEDLQQKVFAEIEKKLEKDGAAP